MPGLTQARIMSFLLTVFLLGIFDSGQSNAQFNVIGQPTDVGMSSEVNVILKYESRDAVSGITINLPPTWEVVSATHRTNKGEYGHMAVELTAASRVQLDGSLPLKNGSTILLRLKANVTSGVNRMEVTPSKKTSSGLTLGDKTTVELSSHGYGPRLNTNKTAKFVKGRPQAKRTSDPSERPIIHLPEAVQLKYDAPYTISAWVKTTTVNSVVLSTWTGNPDDDYALEWVVDPTGFLEFYRGYGSKHVSMRSQKPIADGNWHFLSFVYDPVKEWSRLAIDGVVEDSLFHALSFPNSAVSRLGLGQRVGPNREADISDFVGEMDDVRISPSAWRRAKIALEMQRPSTGKDYIIDFEKSNIPGLQTSRSDLRIGNPISISVSSEDQKVFLEWKAEGGAIQRFRVERSYDGELFASVGTVSALGSIAGSPFTYSEVVEGKEVVYYRIIPILASGTGGASPVVKVGLGKPAEKVTAKLDSNFPNPFNPTTTIRYEVYATQHIRISVWDLSGQMVASLMDGVQSEGVYEVFFNASDLPSGTYFARLVADSGVQTHQMLLMK